MLKNDILTKSGKEVGRSVSPQAGDARPEFGCHIQLVAPEEHRLRSMGEFEALRVAVGVFDLEYQRESDWRLGEFSP